MNHPKTRFAAVISSTILSLVLAATTCGTFAWFTYASNVYVHEYKGVTIGSLSLEVGYVSDVEFDEANIYGVSEIEKTEDDKYIYWFRNGFSDESLHKLISLNGYSPDFLYPVTSGSYNAGQEDFSLLRAPMNNDNYTREEAASKDYYSRMTLAFRTSDELKPGVYLNNTDVFFNITEIKSDFEIIEALRIYSSNITEDETYRMRHLINLDQTIDSDGYDEVGGVLDLNGDGFYDTLEDEQGRLKETYYGEFENVEGDQSIVHYNASPRNGDSDQVGKQTTFNARHRSGAYEIDSNITKPQLAYFEHLGKFQQEIVPVTRTMEYSVQKDLGNGYEVTKENIAFLDLTLFVEGWDLKAVNPDIFGQERPFDMSFQFEVVL